MTRVFGEDGRARAGTILIADPITVTQVKTKEGKDAYSAIQVGVGVRRTKNISKAVLGHTKGKGYTDIREIRTENVAEVGSTIDASVFSVGDTVQVSGISKGKGFAGVVKRHGFHGGPRTHGQKHTDRVTVTNLKVLVVDKEAGKIIVSGAVPGRRGTLLEVVSA